MKLNNYKDSVNTKTPLSSRQITEVDHDSQLGLRVDQAALLWLSKQSKQQFFNAFPAIHPVVFLRSLLEQVYNESDVKLKRLLKNSFRHKNLPSQHLNDYYFTRSLKYLSQSGCPLRIVEGQAQAGDIVVFVEHAMYTRIQWSLCGSAGRLYHVDAEGKRVVCSNLEHINKAAYIIRPSA